MIKVYGLKTEYLNNPIGIDAEKPRFSWKIESCARNSMQSAYRILAAEDENFAKVIWDSGKIETDDSQRIKWAGPELESGQRVYWRVTVWVNSEEAVSEWAFFEMGLLDKAKWKAKWIEPEGEIDFEAFKPAPYIRKEFTVKKDLVSARAYMTAKGLYSFYVNGTEGTDNLFTPGYTSYYKRLQYQTYDITHLIKEGNNALGVILGDGWWRGAIGAFNFRNNFGCKLAFLGQIVLSYEDGTIEVIGSDNSFKTSYGPILMSDMKVGETFDARVKIDGWNRPGFDDYSWKNVQVTEDGFENLIGTRSVPVRKKERFTPKILKTPNGEKVLDFGQNIAGWVEMKVQGTKGTEVILIHGETLDKDGNFTLKNLGITPEGPKDFQEIRYILKGEGVEFYNPHFAIFGFRYVLVKNYPGEVKSENFTGVAIYSDLEETGTFSCSNTLINQLVSNSIWSQKGNFMEVPTDCPTRERAGWTGDAQLYCRTASDFMNVYPFFEKWLADLAAEQYENGAVAITVPGVDYHSVSEFERKSKMEPKPMFPLVKPGEPGFVDGSAGWGDAAVIVPWTMYLCYGDRDILEKQFDSAKAWVDYMDSCAKETNEQYNDTPAYKNYTDGEIDADYIWDTRFHFGEWLEADVMPGGHEEVNRVGAIDKVMVATSYYGYSTHLLSKMAAVLSKKEEEEKYKKLFEKIKRVYNKYFIKDNGHILNDRQAPNVRTLAFDLAQEDKKQAIADRLAEIVKEKDYQLNTGFLSTPFILHVLADNGYADAAFRLLEQDTCPSWLYAVTKEATTIWENWKGVTPEGEVEGSLNHYAYGAVCDFLFAAVAGIQPVIEKPGYKHFIIKPLPGGTLTQAAAKYESIYGNIESSWEKTDEGICYSFVIPVNTTASILLPGDESDLEIVTKEFKDARYEEGRIKFQVGSGGYNILIARD